MTRIDVELVNRGYAKTRTKAGVAIKSGIVFCNGKCITKNSFNVQENDIISVQGEMLKYVSRGGFKLEKALNTFNINLKNKVMCDIGSSTGGFSDCAIQNGIKKIYAIDVGSNQFDNSLRQNKKIFLYENTDFRNFDEDILKDVDIITIDVSFISVTKLINKISKLQNAKEIVCLIKPQFECGKENADKYKGIILNKKIHYEVIIKLLKAFKNINYKVQSLTYSPIRGGSGNIEYLMYLTKDGATEINILKIIDEAFSKAK